MKPLLKTIITIALIFASTFILAKLTGLLSIEQVKDWLSLANELSPFTVGALVALLLFADLFIAVPTLTITILAGFFIGFPYGVASAFSGMMLAGVCGYALSRGYGEKFLRFLIRDPDEIEKMKVTFQRHGVIMILLSRAAPILPEVSACLAGMTGMPFRTFLMAWVLNTLPYTLIAVYAGSVSTLDNPKPAIVAAIGLSGFFWCSWYFFRKRTFNDSSASNEASAS